MIGFTAPPRGGAGVPPSAIADSMPRSSGLNVSTGRTILIGYCSAMFFLALGLFVAGYYIYGAAALSLSAIPFLIQLARKSA